ncbi:MAG TPA: hypothetical protein VMO47_10975 [Rhodothermales bacterium]|nr:hypothetical protein [Rhodothermales bacterium]
MDMWSGRSLSSSSAAISAGVYILRADFTGAASGRKVMVGRTVARTPQ